MIKHKRFAFLSLLFFVVVISFLSGCYYEKEFIFANMNYHYVYDKTIDFIDLRNWEIVSKDRDKGLVKVALRERTVPSLSEIAPYRSVTPRRYEYEAAKIPEFQAYGGPKIIKDIIFIKIRQSGRDVIVKLWTDTESAWNPHATFNEYENFIKSE